MATNGHSGYPLKWFKDQNAVRHTWECAICLEVLQDTVQVRDCGHQFCALCVDDILKTDPRCPTCRIEISNAMIFEDHAARRMIKQLDVNCCNEGCSWQGCLSSLIQDHQNSCTFLIHSGDKAHQIDVKKLEQKLETLITLKFSALERQHKEDIRELKLKHENDLKAIKSKYEEDMRLLGQKIEVLQKSQVAHTFVQQPLPCKEPEGDYTMKISNFTRKLAEAKSMNDFGRIESEPFFTRHGYKMKLWVDLNGAPCGYAGYIGIYMVLMKSDRDWALSWPFTKRYTFTLIDQQDDLSQRKNIEEDVIPQGEENFERPRQLQNNGFGERQFAKHSTLRTRQYIQDHNVLIKLFIDP